MWLQILNASAKVLRSSNARGIETPMQAQYLQASKAPWKTPTQRKGYNELQADAGPTQGQRKRICLLDNAIAQIVEMERQAGGGHYRSASNPKLSDPEI